MLKGFPLAVFINLNVLYLFSFCCLKYKMKITRKLYILKSAPGQGHGSAVL